MPDILRRLLAETSARQLHTAPCMPSDADAAVSERFGGAPVNLNLCDEAQTCQGGCRLAA